MSFFPDDPYLSRKMSPEEENIALYDAEVLYMDHYTGQFFQKLKDYNLYDKSWIIVTADHGELLGEHGQLGHGLYLYQEELQIPLLMKYPAKQVSPTLEDTTVQLTDILPMILERLGIEVPQGIQGAVPPQVKHPLLAEVYPLPTSSKEGDWRAIFEGDFKFIWNSKDNHMLFNLKDDPKENRNLISQDSERADMMMERLDHYLAALPGPGPSLPTKKLDKQTKEALKSLGYVD
jgi:arylsulfatase A-like enzyme